MVQNRPVKVPLPREFYVSLLATVFFFLSMSLIIPLVPLYVTDELKAAEHWIGTATLMIAFSAVATRIPGGILSDSVGRRQIMLIGAAISAAASVMYVISSTLIVFLLARVCTGIGLGLFTTAGKALAADLAPTSRRGEAMGYTNAAATVASVVSPLISVGLKNAVNFQAVFVLSAVLGVLTFIISFTLPSRRPQRATEQTARGDLGAVLHERGIWAATISIMALAPLMSVIFTYFPLMAERKDLLADSPRLLSSVAIGMGLSIWALCDTLIEPIAGRVSDRVGRLIVALPGMAIAIIGLLALARANNTQSTYLAIAVTATGWGMARAITDALVQDAVAPALRGMGAAILYTGFDLSVGGSAQALGAVISGSDFTTFFRLTLIITLVLGAIGAALAAHLQPYDRRHPASISQVSVGVD